jgi:hypothetical protein
VETGSASENASSKADAHSDRKTGIELLQNMRGGDESMIRKSGDRFSEKIVLKQERA